MMDSLVRGVWDADYGPGAEKRFLTSYSQKVSRHIGENVASMT